VPQNGRAILLSFSGIDGAGKSTQISALQSYLTEIGVRVMRLTFWDHAAVLTHFRQAASYGIFKGDEGIGTPDRPLNRRDKNVTSWYLTIVRLLFYLLDSLHLTLVVRRARASGTDVVIFDRYIYDELANLASNRWLIKAYIRMVLKCVPCPDIAYLLDADPLHARNRKPEYPIDFLQTNRAAYLNLTDFAKMTVIGPLPVLEVEQEIVKNMQERLHCSDLTSLAGGHAH